MTPAFGWATKLPAAVVLEGENPLIPGEAQKFTPHGYAVLVLDGPTLKEEVRDPFGHVIYDRVIRTVAEERTRGSRFTLGGAAEAGVPRAGQSPRRRRGAEGEGHHRPAAHSEQRSGSAGGAGTASARRTALAAATGGGLEIVVRLLRPVVLSQNGALDDLPDDNRGRLPSQEDKDRCDTSAR